MLSAFEITDDVRSKRRSAAEVLGVCLDAAASRNDAVHAFLRIDEDYAKRQAAVVDDKVARGETLGVLAGVPVAVKDNICTEWGATTCASKILKDYRSPYSAHVIELLEAADAVIVGKTNLDEFAMGSSTENSCAGVTRNPWNPDRVAGGSSGGSVAAVSAGMVPLALGSDTGGSIRQPAAFCNVTGLKPGYGCVSRYGLVAFGSSLDQIGPIARDARDVALLLGVIAGHDARDSTSVNHAVPDYADTISAPPVNLKIGIPAEYFGDGLDAEVRGAVEDAIKMYERNEAEIIEIHLPHLKYAIACYYVICTAEVSSNLARFDGVHYGHRTASPDGIVDLYAATRAEGFGTEVKRRIMLGTFALSSGYHDAYYLKALKVRTLLKQDFDRAFERVDVIASPTAPTPAFAIGERTDDPLAMYLADVYTVSANLAGICAISIPCGFSSDGLPIGLQLQAPAFAEQRLLQTAHAYQTCTDWHNKEPTAVNSRQ